MRERVEYGEVARREPGSGTRRPGRWTGPWQGRRAAAGPRPVRPAGVPVKVRPLEAPRPVRDVGAGVERAGGGPRGNGSGPRPSVRRGVVSCGGPPVRSRLYRVVAAVTVVAASAAVVVALGLLARVAEPVPGPVRAPAPVVVTVAPGETVWDVAARLAPGRPGAEVAAVAERIVSENALGSVRPEPGQVLRVAHR